MQQQFDFDLGHWVEAAASPDGETSGGTVLPPEDCSESLPMFLRKQAE